jgi:hypothetical protein
MPAAWSVLLLPLQPIVFTASTFDLAIADLTELQLPSNINISFPEGKEKPMHFEITIKPDEGYYR